MFDSQCRGWKDTAEKWGVNDTNRQSKAIKERRMSEKYFPQKEKGLEDILAFAGWRLAPATRKLDPFRHSVCDPPRLLFAVFCDDTTC